jgi:hypothetical protein
MKWIARILFFLFVFFGRIILIALGWVTVGLSVLGNGHRQTPRIWRIWANSEEVLRQGWQPADASRWDMYVEMAWRNPTMGLRDKLKQPIPEVQPNPDFLVRTGKQNVATRVMTYDYYFEFWRLSRFSKPLLGKWNYFEIRVGWKFVDESSGQDTFYPTIQLGPRK